MAKTMVANITGARLRETERELALLRGEAAVTAFLEAHPNETKVLQQIVDWRRAGRPTPSLTRVQRAMVWSDGTIELSTVSTPEPAGRGAPGRPGAFGSGPASGGRPQRGGRGAPTGSFGGPPRGPGGTGRPGGSGGPGRPGGPARPGGSGRGSSFNRQGRPGQRWSADRDGAGTAGLPRSGEGWALMRPGEQPPADVVPEAPEDTPEVIEVADHDGGAERAEATGNTGTPPAAPETPPGA